MAEYKVREHWVISSGGLWLEGLFASRRAARLAFRVDDAIQGRAWRAKAGPDGTIPESAAFTEDEIRALIRETREMRQRGAGE